MPKKTNAHTQKMPKKTSAHWSNAQLERLWSSVAVVLPPADDPEEWDGVASMFNAGATKKMKKTSRTLFRKFCQLHKGPSTGGGGRRSGRQEKTTRMYDIMVKLDKGGSLTRTDERFLREVNTSNFERNFFERPEFEDTTVAAEETTVAAITAEETTVAAEETTVAAEETTVAVEETTVAAVAAEETTVAAVAAEETTVAAVAAEETTAAADDDVVCVTRKRLNFMVFEEKALMRTIRETRKRCRDWEQGDLNRYHEMVQSEIETELSSDIHMKVLTKQRYLERQNFQRSLSSLARKSSALFASRNKEYCEILKQISKTKDADVTPRKKNTDIFRGPARQPASAVSKKRDQVYDLILREFGEKKEPVTITPPRVKRARKVIAVSKETGIRNDAVGAAEAAISSYMCELMEGDSF